MKPFFSFVQKEFYHILRDKRTMLILLGMPVIEIVLFGFAISTEVRNVRITVYDASGDELTRRITERIDANEHLEVTGFLMDPTLIDRELRNKEANMVMVYESDFNRNTLQPEGASVQLIADATDANMATLFTGYANWIIGDQQKDLLSAYEDMGGVTAETKLLYNPGMKSAYHFVPGVMGMILMLLCAMMTSISIVREKEVGTMEVLLVSPVRPLFMIVAKTVPYFVLSCINLATILLLARFLLHVPLAGSMFLLLSVSLLFILVSLAFGILISTIAKTQVVAMLISGMVLMMPVMVFSGLIYPPENMPWVLRWFSHLIPAKWYILAVRKVMIEGLDLAYVYREIAILTAMGIVLIGASILKFNNRLDQ